MGCFKTISIYSIWQHNSFENP